MKKILPITFMVILSLSTSAQNIGLRVSYVITNWEGLAYDLGQEITAINGFSGGIYGHAPLNPIIAFEPGIFITQKGTHMAGDSFTAGAFTNESIYLDVPIMVKMYIGGAGFHVDAGPQVSYLLANKVVPDDGGAELVTKDQISPWDFSVNFGLAYDVKMGLVIAASFDLGLSQMLVNEYYDWTEASNRVIRFSVGYTFY
jgi:hypothetical protein